MGLRHGYGSYTLPGGTNYSGQWAHDLKHGYGKLTIPGVSEVTGVWLHDRLNGRAMRTLPGKGQSEVIYKDDLALDLTVGFNCNQKCYFFWAPLFDIIVGAGVALGVL